MQELAIPPVVAAVPPPPSRRVTIRACRPSLIDLRFKGDPWVVLEQEQAAVRLGDFSLGQVNVSPLDVPSLTRCLLQVRFGQARRNYVRRHRKLGGGVCCPPRLPADGAAARPQVGAGRGARREPRRSTARRSQ